MSRQMSRASVHHQQDHIGPPFLLPDVGVPCAGGEVSAQHGRGTAWRILPHRFRQGLVPTTKTTPRTPRLGPIDHSTFSRLQRRLVEVHLEMPEHTADALTQHDLAQRVTDVFVARARSDLVANAFFANEHHAVEESAWSLSLRAKPWCRHQVGKSSTSVAGHGANAHSESRSWRTSFAELYKS